MAGTYSAGTAFLQVVPSFLGVQEATKAEAAKMGAKFENALERALPEGVAKGAKAAQPAAAKAGVEWAGEFADAAQKRLRAAFQSLPEAKPGVDLSEFDRKIAEMRARIESVHDLHVNGEIDSARFMAEVEVMRRELKSLERDAPNLDQFLNLQAAGRFVDELGAMGEHARREGFQAGSTYGGAFADAVRARIDATLSHLPRINIDADPTPAQRAIGVLRTELEVIRDAHVRAELDDGEFLVKLRYIQAQLEKLAAATTDVSVKFNAEHAIAEIKKFADVDAPREAAKAADRAGGAFETKFNEKIRAALAHLPEIRINADTTDADVAIAHVRGQLAELSDANIGVDLDDATAMLKLEELKVRLDELAAKSPSVRVRAEAAAAAVELGMVLNLANRVDRSDPTVRVKTDTDTSGLRKMVNSIDQMTHASGAAGSRLGVLIAIGASLGTALVPAAAAASVAIAGIATAAGAAISGIGVMVLGFTGIGGAVQALSKYQQDTAKSAASLTTSENRVSGALDAVSSSERSLANTREQVAYASQRAAQTIVDAQRGITDAEKQAMQARLDLTQAYEDARRAQEDMTLSIRANALAQRQANLDVKKAKDELEKIMLNPRATEAEREQARITYEQRVLQLDDIGVKQKRLQVEKDAADKAGIQGSTQVQAAQEKVQQATDNIAKAQQRLGQAVEEQSQQQRQGAFQIAQAQQALANAHRQVEQSATQAGVAGGAALQNLQIAMDQLGPAGKRFAEFLFSLKGNFLSLRDAAQGGMLPGVQRGIETLLPSIASLQRFIGNVANQLGSMFEDMARQMQMPTWRAFFGFIRDQTVPALRGMYTFTMDIARGLVALLIAMSPFNRSMGQGLLNMAEGFAKWAETLNQNQGFQHFLSYVRDEGPHVVNLLKQMAIFVGRFVAAAMPIGAFVVRLFESFFSAINSWPMSAMTLLVGSIALLAGGMIAAAIAMRALKFALAIGGLISMIGGLFNKGATAVGNFRARISESRNEVAGFGAGIQAAGNAVVGTGQKFKFFEGMSGRIMNSARNAVARYTAAITTATGQVGLLARAQELAGAAMGRFIVGPVTAAMARYAAAVTTATGQVGLLARAQELAGAAMGRIAGPASAAMARYAAAVTTANGQMGLLARATEVAGNAGAAAMARYAAAVTAANGQIGLLARATEVAGNAGAAAMARYAAAVTAANGQIGLLARSQELVGAAAQRVSTTASMAMGRYTAAITTANGEIGLLARSQELAGAATRTAASVGSAAWIRVTEAIQMAVSRTGALTAAQNLAAATMSRTGAIGTAAMNAVGAAAGSAAIKTDAAMAKAGTGVKNAAGLAVKGLGGLTSALGGPVGIALLAGTIAWGVYSAHVAEVKARVDALSKSLDSYAETMKGGLTPATIEQAHASLESDKSLRDLVETTRRLGIENSTLVRGINGEKTARDEVIGALDAEIEKEKQKAKEAFGFGDWMFGFGKKEYSQHIARVTQLEEERTAFAKRNTENAAAGKLTEDLTAELNKQKQMIGDVGAAFTNSSLDATGFKAAINEVGGSSVDLSTKMNVLEALAAKVGRAQFDGATKAGLFRDVLDQIGDSTELHGPKFDALSGVFNTIATSALTAKDKTDLLKKSLDQLYGASISQNEADEALVRTQGDLSDQLATSSAGFDLNTGKTIAQKVEIVKNRDALEAAATATREKFVADIAAAKESDNVTLATQNARTAHDEATKSLINQIPEAYRNSAAVQDLVNRYGGIPGDVSTKYSTDESFTTLYNQLRQVSFMQQQIKEGASPERAQALWNQQEQSRKGIFGPYYMPGKADGGLIDGPWQGPKADNVLIRANPREFVQQVSAVDYYGVPFMKALNRRAIPKGTLPGFANGGLITDKSRGQGAYAEWPVKASLAGAWNPSLNEALGFIGGSLGNKTGAGGWQWQINALRAAFPGLALFSGFRPGDMAESGLSYHSKGRAVDVPPRMDVFNWIKANYGANTPELIFSPAGPRQVWNGREHTFTGEALVNAHYNHVHWAYRDGGLVGPGGRPKLYDNGGLLQPGWNPPIYNGTGRPEPVLNPSQWADMNAAARGGEPGGGNTYVFPFRDTTLTESKLRSMQAADALRARDGRSR